MEIMRKKIIMPFDSEVEANDYKNNNPTSKANWKKYFFYDEFFFFV